MIDLERGPTGLDVTTSGTGELAGSRPALRPRPPLRIQIAFDQLEEYLRRDRVLAYLRDDLGRLEFKRRSGVDSDRLGAWFWQIIEFWTAVVWEYRTE